MSEKQDDDSFLARWSRRKVAAREGEPLAEPEAPKPAPAAAGVGVPDGAGAGAAPPTELPSLDSLEGLKSDYKAFMQPGVAEDVRRAAVKKLFADPHFNVMDGLDVYIDDYTNFEPLPAEMLSKIAAVKYLFREPDAEQKVAAPASEGAPQEAEATALPEGPPEAAAGTGADSGVEPAPGPPDETVCANEATLEPQETAKPESVRKLTDS